MLNGQCEVKYSLLYALVGTSNRYLLKCPERWLAPAHPKYSSINMHLPLRAIGFLPPYISLNIASREIISHGSTWQFPQSAGNLSRDFINRIHAVQLYLLIITLEHEFPAGDSPTVDKYTYTDPQRYENLRHCSQLKICDLAFGGRNSETTFKIHGQVYCNEIPWLSGQNNKSLSFRLQQNCIIQLVLLHPTLLYLILYVRKDTYTYTYVYEVILMCICM